ncbi:hypothetical protein K402DRAFT_395765, partial [Aulographum hederae CBS 113979]
MAGAEPKQTGEESRTANENSKDDSNVDPDWDMNDPANFRPLVVACAENKFRTNDKVWLTEPGSRVMKGPFLIAAMSTPGSYTLCLEDGTSFENGKVFAEGTLSFV